MKKLLKLAAVVTVLGIGLTFNLAPKAEAHAALCRCNYSNGASFVTGGACPAVNYAIRNGQIVVGGLLEQYCV
jgi:hypothetical protein